jgi:hypothetical protein
MYFISAALGGKEVAARQADLYEQSTTAVLLADFWYEFR